MSVEGRLHRDAQQRHDATDRGQGHGMTKLGPDELSQDRQRPRSDRTSCAPQWGLVSHRLSQRLHLRRVELRRAPRNWLGL